MEKNLSGFTFTNRISKSLGGKCIVLSICEFSKSKPFNHKTIFDKSSILDAKSSTLKPQNFHTVKVLWPETAKCK